jgi:hypothetical protein
MTKTHYVKWFVMWSWGVFGGGGLGVCGRPASHNGFPVDAGEAVRQVGAVLAGGVGRVDGRRGGRVVGPRRGSGLAPPWIWAVARAGRPARPRTSAYMEGHHRGAPKPRAKPAATNCVKLRARRRPAHHPEGHPGFTWRTTRHKAFRPGIPPRTAPCHVFCAVWRPGATRNGGMVVCANSRCTSRTLTSARTNRDVHLARYRP